MAVGARASVAADAAVGGSSAGESTVPVGTRTVGGCVAATGEFVEVALGAEAQADSKEVISINPNGMRSFIIFYETL
jgi:hypothetical protein